MPLDALNGTGNKAKGERLKFKVKSLEIEN